ncbi:MAG: malonyl-ACP O-methyltransferase BioC [Legionella sp.]|nr:malonyl-ACP O-methyltransferase BioC [Legionella sp.]
MNVVNEISKAFNSQAFEYESAAIVQKEIGRRLLERLQYMKIAPERILDLGCGTGYLSRELRLKYPKSQIVGLDLAKSMLLQARNKQGWRRRWSLVSADMNCLPFADGQFDLVFANQAVHWGSSMQNVFGELNRVMKVQGCLMFTTLGPDTFKELKKAWSGVNDHAHTNEFPDMHDVGDWLMAEHFLEPVVDMENLTVHYQSLQKLVQGLKKQGVKNINPQRNKGLTSRAAWANFLNNYELLRTENGSYPLSYEVIYGQAWKGELRQKHKDGETFISLSQIKKM